jgi:hypothetical protein
MDTTPLRDAYRALLDAAGIVADTSAAPPDGEWNADQVLPGHTNQLLALLPDKLG